MKNKRNTQFLIPLAAAAAVFAVFFLYDTVLSFVNYKPVRGLLGSPYIGLSNYERLSQTPQILSVLGNSLLHSMAISAAGLPMGLLLTQVLTPVERRIKAALAGVFLTIALVPDLVWMQLVQTVASSGGLRDLLTDPMLYPVLLIAAKLLPQTALCAFAGLCVSLSGGKKPAAGAMLAGMLPALTALLPDMRIDLLLGNAMNRASSDSLATLAYRYSLMNAQYSFGGAVMVVGTLLSLIIGVGAAYVIGSMADQSLYTPRAALDGDGRKSEGLTAAAGALFAALAVLLVTPRGAAADELLGSAAANTLLCAFGAAILGYGVCVAATSFLRDGSGFVLGLFGMLMLIPGAISASDYLLARTFSLINTPLPIMLGVLSHPAFIAVVLVLVLCRPGKEQLQLCAGGAALAAAALCAGDWLYPTVFTIANDQIPLAGLARRALLTGEGGGLWPMTVICLVLSAAAAALIAMGVGAAEKTDEEES